MVNPLKVELNVMCRLLALEGAQLETNKELDELIKHRNIINYVKAQRLSFLDT